MVPHAFGEVLGCAAVGHVPRRAPFLLGGEFSLVKQVNFNDPWYSLPRCIQEVLRGRSGRVAYIGDVKILSSPTR